MEARVVVVSDGKRGHENQSRVLARMLGDPEPLLMLLRDSVKDGGIRELLIRIQLGAGWARRMDQLQAARLVQRFLRPDDIQAFRDFTLQHKEQPGKQVITVSSGTPPATFNLILARMLRCPAIVNMSPSLLPHSLFDLVVMPEHDMKGRKEAANEISTPLALGYHNQAAAHHLAVRLKNEYLLGDATYWAVAVGGPSKSCRWEGDVVLDELAVLHGLAKGEGARLLVTTSRRTPEWCLAWMKQHYCQSESVAYFLDASKDPLNPLPAFYELCTMLFVTGDSFSMASEAVHAGHQPQILKVQPALPDNKLGQALTRLAKLGLVLLADPAGEELPLRLARGRETRTSANLHFDELRKLVIARLQRDMS